MHGKQAWTESRYTPELLPDAAAGLHGSVLSPREPRQVRFEDIGASLVRLVVIVTSVDVEALAELAVLFYAKTVTPCTQSRRLLLNVCRA